MSNESAANTGPSDELSNEVGALREGDEDLRPVRLSQLEMC